MLAIKDTSLDCNPIANYQKKITDQTLISMDKNDLSKLAQNP